MTNRPDTASTNHAAHRTHWIGAAALVALVTALGCGGDDSEFLFQFRDRDDRPIAGVVVYDVAGSDTLIVGRTGRDGKVVVASGYLAQLPREFGFRLPTAHGPVTKEFDPDRCRMVHSATVESYRCDPDAGSVGPEDLAVVPDGWSTPGRIVTLERDPAAGTGKPEIVDTASMELTIPIVTVPGATVKLDGFDVGETDARGELSASFCWLVEEAGDWVPRTGIDVEIARPGHVTWRQRVRIPDDGNPGLLRVDLERVVDTTTPTPPEAYVNLRVRLMTTTVRSCGVDFLDLPVLYVNDETTAIRLPAERGNGWDNNEFDLIVKAGQDYCLAVACPGAATETTWIPWDGSANGPRWYRLPVPADARQMVVHLTDDLDPDRPLQPEPGKTPAGFDQASRVTVRSGCGR